MKGFKGFTPSHGLFYIHINILTLQMYYNLYYHTNISLIIMLTVKKNKIFVVI